MSDLSQRLLHALKSQHSTMVSQLEALCSINSGSDNLAGLAKVSDHLTDLFTPIADQVDRLTFEPITTINMAGETTPQHCGDALFIRKRAHLPRRILLVGHMDTVFSASNPFQSLTYKDENCINGPGVTDMKGGLIVMLHALQTFEQSPVAADIGWDVLINADEEIGSLCSAPVLQQIAKNYQAGLVYEPAMADGSLAKNRKGSGKLTLIVDGKSAHAGRDFYAGRNAICHLAEIIIAIHALNDPHKGVTINVGKIAGGDALNRVPDKAVAKLDIRISADTETVWVMDEIQRILDRCKHPDYSVSLQGGFGRPVKKVSLQTQRLFERIKALGQQLGLTIDWKDSGGCCDGNNLAHCGLPVIDTLGVRGGAIHSADEFILLDSLVERSSLSFLLLQDLASGGLEGLHS